MARSIALLVSCTIDNAIAGAVVIMVSLVSASSADSQPSTGSFIGPSFSDHYTQSFVVYCFVVRLSTLVHHCGPFHSSEPMHSVYMYTVSKTQLIVKAGGASAPTLEAEEACC